MATSPLQVERGPRRRAMIMSLSLGLFFLWGWTIAEKVWYQFKPLAASQFISSQYHMSVQVPDLTTLSAWQLTLPYTSGNPLTPAPALTELFGMPLPLALLLIAGLLTLIGSFSHSAIFPIIGVIIVNFARAVISTMEANLGNPTFAGKFMHELPAVAEFTTVVWVTMLIMGVLAIQIGYSNYRVRKLNALQGVHEPSFMDSLWTIQSSAVNRVTNMDQARTGAQGVNQAAAPHLPPSH